MLGQDGGGLGGWWVMFGLGNKDDKNLSKECDVRGMFCIRN